MGDVLHDAIKQKCLFFMMPANIFLKPLNNLLFNPLNFFFIVQHYLKAIGLPFMWRMEHFEEFNGKFRILI